MSAPASAVKIGPWGGSNGEVYQFRGVIRGIRVTSGDFVTSIYFQLADGTTVKIGGRNGDGSKVQQANLRPKECLDNVSGTIADGSGKYLTSIAFHTNMGSTYGPFGKPTTTTFSVPLECDVVTGMFGRHGWYVDALGFYATPA